MKRAALATASALSLTAVLTAVLTACSAGDSDAGAKAANSPSSPRAKQASPEERLAKLLVTKADANYTVTKPVKGDALAASQEEMRVDKAACTPLAYATNELPIGEPEASLTRVAKNSSSMSTYITLATYADGKAATAMKELSQATAACTGGFTAKSDSGSNKYDSVTVETAPSGGDESVAAASTFQFRYPQTIRTQTFRFGDTIANYFTLDVSAFVQSPRPGNAKIPADLVKAQNAKLG